MNEAQNTLAAACSLQNQGFLENKLFLCRSLYENVAYIFNFLNTVLLLASGHFSHEFGHYASREANAGLFTYFNTTWEGGRGQVLPDVEF